MLQRTIFSDFVWQCGIIPLIKVIVSIPLCRLTQYSYSNVPNKQIPIDCDLQWELTSPSQSRANQVHVSTEWLPFYP